MKALARLMLIALIPLAGCDKQQPPIEVVHPPSPKVAEREYANAVWAVGEAQDKVLDLKEAMKRQSNPGALAAMQEELRRAMDHEDAARLKEEGMHVQVDHAVISKWWEWSTRLSQAKLLMKSQDISIRTSAEDAYRSLQAERVGQ